MRANEFKKLLESIQAGQKDREDEVRLTLKNFQDEYGEMAESLRSLLNRGETIKTKDFKGMLKDIRQKQLERDEEARKRLDEYKKERQDMASEWQKLNIAMAQRRTGGLKGGEKTKKEKVVKV